MLKAFLPKLSYNPWKSLKIDWKNFLDCFPHPSTRLAEFVNYEYYSFTIKVPLVILGVTFRAKYDLFFKEIFCKHFQRLVYFSLLQRSESPLQNLWEIRPICTLKLKKKMFFRYRKFSWDSLTYFNILSLHFSSFFLVYYILFADIKT